MPTLSFLTGGHLNRRGIKTGVTLRNRKVNPNYANHSTGKHVIADKVVAIARNLAFWATWELSVGRVSPHFSASGLQWSTTTTRGDRALLRANRNGRLMPKFVADSTRPATNDHAKA